MTIKCKKKFTRKRRCQPWVGPLRRLGGRLYDRPHRPIIPYVVMVKIYHIKNHISYHMLCWGVIQPFISHQNQTVKPPLPTKYNVLGVCCCLTGVMKQFINHKISKPSNKLGLIQYIRQFQICDK